MIKTHRYIRVLVYEGTPEFIQHCKANRQVKGSHLITDTRTGTTNSIKEAEIGDFIEEVLSHE